ncbi:MAG: hypothetical protein KUG77_13085 [Nannocystaceae bacterium]|nr:hypothetical protein [Nannocystaceae bacterium]
MNGSTRTALAVGLLILVAGCPQETPRVEVNTYVGKSFERSDPELARKAAKKVFAALVDEFSASTPDAPAVVDTVTTHPPTTQEEFEELVAAVRKGPLDELAGPARRLAASDPSLWPEIRERLLAPRKAPKGDYRSLLAAIGGDVPNKYGYFARAWKRAHGHDIKLSGDWFEDLLSLPRSKVSPGLLSVYRDCVLETSLLRAASRVGSADPKQTRDVVAALLDAAYVHRGTFRDEVGRAMLAVGDEAIPSLVEASLSPSRRKRDQEKPEVKRAKYAELILDKMDRLHPARATEAVQTSPRLLAEVLGSYAIRRPGEAASVLLAFSDDRSAPVRAAARTSFGAYVTGPAPKSAGRTVRLLGGGTGKALAYLNYRDRARLALLERLGEQAPDLLEPECEVVSETGKVDTRCEQQPARHANLYMGWLDTRRAEAQRTAVDSALASADLDVGAEALDRLIAQGELSEPVRVATFFADHAAQLRHESPKRAAALFRKASMLFRSHDSDRSAALHADALAVEASLEDLPRAGRLMLLDRALEVRDDVELRMSRTTLASAPAFEASSVGRVRLWAGAGLIGAVLLACGVLGGPLRRRLKL